MTGIVMGLEACQRLSNKLIEIMEMQEKQNKKAMSDKIVFRIPNGYEIDYEQSNDEKLVYKKKEEYEPKEWDLVYSEIPSHDQQIISFFKQPSLPSIIRGFSDCSNNWQFSKTSGWISDHVRPATAEETKIFMRILKMNGYVYDPEKRAISWSIPPRRPFFL